MGRADADDASLVRAALEGSAEAFERLVRAHHRSVYRLAWGACRNHADADDVVQAVFVKAYSALESFDPDRASFRTWLRRLTVNAAIDLLRRESRHRRSRPLEPGDVRAPAPARRGPEAEAETAELTALVREAVDELPGEQRMIVVLHAVEGLKSSEIAEIMGSTPRSVRARLCQARKKLFARMRRHLGGYLGG